MPAPSPLPGIRIDVAPPPLAEVLPRMDVAVFVGFAATGPTHTPVVIEDIAQYTAVFGRDIPLAWDAERNERVVAHLGSAVRGFFSNGGRRCWVIRVARTAELEARWRGLSESALAPADIAVANRFAVPGVLMLPKGGARLAPAQAQARSVGAWSDAFRVSTALTLSGFGVEECAMLSPSPPEPRIRFSTNAALKPGDLIEFGDSTVNAAGGLRIYATVDQVSTQVRAVSARQQVEATLCAAFQELDGNAGSPPSFRIGSAEVVGVTGGPLPAMLETYLTPRIPARIGFRIRFDVAVPSGLAEGHWARWSDGVEIVWLRIDALDRHPALADPNVVNVVAEGAGWRESELALPDLTPARASLLTIDLRVLKDQESEVRLAGVGLTPAHRSGWWQQVGDDPFYGSLRRDRASPLMQPPPPDTTMRFPLVARDQELGENAPRAWIPLGVTSLYGAALGPLPHGTSALERDGLSRFNAELFLDPELAELSANALIEQANVVQFLSHAPRHLFGVHGALSIGTGSLFNEASLIAVPDALHRGWVKRNDADPLPAIPVPERPPAHWITHRGPCAAAPMDAAITEPDFSGFLDCGTHALMASFLSAPTHAVPPDAFRLRWTASELGAGYALQEAEHATFEGAREVYRGAALEYDVHATREGVFYYRVTAIAADERSAASNIVAVVVRDSEWVLVESADYAMGGEAELLRLHRAALRMAAASGELFAVLGLPRHYRVSEAIRYASRLRAVRASSFATDSDGFYFNERRVLSYGALYHPWVVFALLQLSRSGPTAVSNGRRVASAVGQTQSVCPPDGIVTGVLAARASGRGAWIAPANEPFKDVVALTPPIEAEAWLPLQEARVNLVRSDPRGFLTLAADTLSDELEWEPINVRRLIILLRRLALRRGASYVFEPNGDALRRSVDRGFTLLLTDLFRRGAFAGATAAESFKVVTEGAINTSADRDAGRFFAELRVAPSLPLQFLTVRLSQSGERFTVAEEV